MNPLIKILMKAYFFLFTFLVSVSFGYGLDVGVAVKALCGDDYKVRLSARDDLLQAFSQASVGDNPEEQLHSLEVSVIGHLDEGELPLESRLYLLYLLGLFGSDTTVAAIKPLIDHDDAIVRDAVRRALATIPGPKSRACLIEGLEHGSIEERAARMDLLAARKDMDAASTISGMLGSEDEALVAASAVALGKLGNPAVIPALLEAREKAVGETKAVIEAALLRIGIHSGIAGDLVRSGSSGAIRAEAFRQLAKEDPEGAGLVLQSILTGNSFPGSLLLLRSALASDNKALQDTVINHLPAANTSEQLVVVAAVGDLKLTSFESSLLALLPEAEGILRDAIIEALGEIGGDASFAALFDLFLENMKNEKLSHALARVNAVEADKQALATLEGGTDEEARIAAVKVLELRNTEGATKLLNGIASGSSDAKLEEAIFKALETIGDAASTRVLLDRVLRADAGTRAAQRSLKRLSLNMGTPEYLWAEIYRPALEAVGVVEKGAMVLEVLDGVACGDSLEYLRVVLQDSGSALRSTALGVLQRWPMQKGFASADLWLDILAQEATTEEASKAKRALRKMLLHKDKNFNLWQAGLIVKIAKSALTSEDKCGLLDVYDDPFAHFHKSHHSAVKKRMEGLKDDPDVGERIREMLEQFELQKAMAWKPTFDDKPVTAGQSRQIGQALPDAPLAEPKTKRRLLLFSATAGYRHNSIPVGKEALSRMGEITGAYDAVVSDDPANFEKDALQGFDAVLLLSPTQDFFMPQHKKKGDFSDEEWDWLQRRHNRLVGNLVEFVAQGGGLVGIHAATDSCYGAKDYGMAIGGFFDGHPWMANQNVTIVVEDAGHELIQPVFEGMKDFQIRDEIYQFKPEPYSRERLRVLLHLDPNRSDKPIGKTKRDDGDYPVCWVQKFGEGRVFYSSLGHNDHIYWNPLMLKHYLAGIQFACGDLDADATPSAQLMLSHLNSGDRCCP